MSSNVTVKKFLFVDENPEGKQLGEYRIMLGPDSGQLGVCQCNEPTNIPEDSVMIVLEEGDAISVSETELYQAVICQLVAPKAFEHVFGDIDEEVLTEYDIIDVPEYLTGYNIPEGGDSTEDYMSPFNISINASRGLDGEGNIRPEYRKGSIWTRLGRKSKRLFQ